MVTTLAAAVGAAGIGSWALVPVQAQGPAPIPVTPYSGYNSMLARAPYLTDLTQTSVEVNWATTVSASGTVEWGPAGNCSEDTTPVPSQLPTSVPSSDSRSSVTSREYTVEGTKEYQSSVELTGLAPSTEYCYRVYGAGNPPVNLLGTNPSPTFTTLATANPSATAPVTFDVLGDFGEDDQSAGVAYPNNLNPDQAALDELIGQSGADFLLTTGDTAYPGATQDDYGDLTQTGTEESEIFGSSYWPETGGIPTFYTQGDHGLNVTSLRIWPEDTTAAGSSGVFADVSYPDPADNARAGTYPDDWYAFSTGNVRIYVLQAAWGDTNAGSATGTACGAAGTTAADHCESYQTAYDNDWTPSSPQYQWLKSDLAAHPGYVKLAFFHFPLRSDNATQPSDVYLQNSANNPNQATSLESLLDQYNVGMVFNGHAHTYQRIAPQAPGQLVNYVTGGGGGILEPVLGGGTCSGLEAGEAIYALGWSPTTGNGSSCGAPTPESAAQVYNFLKVTVTGDTVTVSPTDAAGAVFDQQSYTIDTGAAPPESLTSSVSASTVVAGGSVTDTAQLSGVGAYATGAITISAYLGSSASACSGAAVVSENASPSTQGGGSYSATFDSLAAGDYEFRAVYAGDQNNPPAASQCGSDPLVVTPPSPWKVASYSASETTPGTTLTISVPPGTSSGDDLVVIAAIREGSTGSIVGITDGGGSSWAAGAVVYSTGVTNRSEYWEATDASAVPPGGAVTISFNRSVVAVAYLLDVAGGKAAMPSGFATAAAAPGVNGAASSGDVSPGALTDLQIGWTQTPNAYTSVGDPHPGFSAGAGVELGWIESSSGTSDRLSLDVSYDEPSVVTSQAYSVAFPGAPAWSTGIATLGVS